jgi:hypothetical protein
MCDKAKLFSRSDGHCDLLSSINGTSVDDGKTKTVVKRTKKLYRDLYKHEGFQSLSTENKMSLERSN